MGDACKDIPVLVVALEGVSDSGVGDWSTTSAVAIVYGSL
jgi:hypothetical protein